ncbi:MAG: DUF2007 domain-containing protein [Sphingomonadaceae bacterium]|nr:DUF2007 domain-containing protein [Sphingomonadaceae bacterium]
MALVEVARFQNPIEAELARSALEAAGLDAVLFDGGVSSAYAGALALTPSRLMTPREQEQAARALLGSMQP